MGYYLVYFWYFDHDISQKIKFAGGRLQVHEYTYVVTFYGPIDLLFLKLITELRRYQQLQEFMGWRQYTQMAPEAAENEFASSIGAEDGRA